MFREIFIIYYKHFAKNVCDFSLILLGPCNFLYKSVFFNSSFRLFPFFIFPLLPSFDTSSSFLLPPPPRFLFTSFVSHPHTRQEKYVLRLLRTALTSLNSTNMQTRHTAVLYCPTSEQPRYSRTSSKLSRHIEQLTFIPYILLGPVVSRRLA